MSKKLLMIGAAGLFVLVTGYLHGKLTNRWGYSATLQASIDKLDQLPLTLDQWEGTIVTKDIEPQTTRFSGAFVVANFVQRQTGDAVSVTLVCGRPGPLSLHPPSICFPAHGYTEKSRPAKMVIPLKGGDVEMLAADYERERPTGAEQIHIRWCYGYDGQLGNPDNPRVTLASRPAVYKLYASRAGLGNRFTTTEDPLQPFLAAFLPELKKVLFGS